MRGRQQAVVGATAAVWLAFVALLSAGEALAAPTTLDDGERLAYARWLGVTAGLSAAADSLPTPGALLFPTLAPWQAEGPSRVACVKLVREVERAGEAPRPPVRTAAQSLDAARAYRALGEYDRALGWYGEAAVRDEGHGLAPELAREALGTAAALGDSLSLARALVNTLGASDLATHADETVLAFRWLIARDDSLNLVLLDRKVDGQVVPLPAPIRFWRAFAATRLQDWPAALAGARGLLAEGDTAAALDRRERLWLAGTLPDLFYLTGDRAAAAELWRQLAASDLDALAPWSRYQLASLDLLARRYDTAAAALRVLCADSEPWPWRPRACALAALADTLDLLAGGGATRGLAAHVVR
ncbi:MAG: hypothetical protein ACYDIE_07360 [Candidatus Krumholzibacteriia bacterium]